MLPANPLISVLIVILALHGFECQSLRRFNHDARLYEHFTLNSPFVQYSRTETNLWKNLSTVAAMKNFTFTSMICTLGPGAWIAYPEPDYSIGNSATIYLVIGEHCIRADDIKSIQPLGKADEFLEQGVLLFESSQFASAHTPITTVGGSGPAGSLIFTGGKSFVVQGSGQKICLRPGMTVFETGYCLIPNIKASLGMEGTLNVKENCTEEEGSDEKRMIVQNCYTDGVHEIYSDQDLSINNLQQICSGRGDDYLKSKFTILMENWSKRLTTFQYIDNEAVQNPYDESEPKLWAFWKAIELFRDTCSFAYPNYLNLLGLLFEMHLTNLQNSPNYKESSTTDEQWEMVAEVLNNCVENNGASYSPNCYSEGLEDSPDYPNTETLTGLTEPDKSWSEIANGEIFDPVVEQMWLILNTVVPNCNIGTDYNNNDWSDLLVIFNENYLQPLQDLWAESGDWKKVYTSVFHGYDIRDQHKQFLDCLKDALQHSPEYDPIGRPKKLKDYITYKFKTPDYGKIKHSKNKRSKRGHDSNIGFIHHLKH